MNILEKMNNLETYIRESIFDKDVKTKIAKTRQELALDELHKYSFKNLNSWEQQHSPWTIGEVIWGEKGVEIYGRFDHWFYIKDLPKVSPIFKISKVVGSLVISQCEELESLQNIFTDDCVIDGRLFVTDNDNLKSLVGCPKKVSQFACLDNACLPFEEYKNGPREVTTRYAWERNKNSSSYSAGTAEGMIRKFLTIKPEKIEVQFLK